MLLFEQEQINILREKCNKAQKRIWISSPFIGSLHDVQTIIGGRWMLPSVDCRILTDMEAGFIRKDTFDAFTENNIEIRSLHGLHAKIYIVDDWCLITSANLTGTAFLCRYEMGSTYENIEDVVNIFNKWWEKAIVKESCVNTIHGALPEYQDGYKFKKLFKAPPYKTEKQDKYDADCEQYNAFANLYAELTGRNSDMIRDGFSLLAEVDYLFNYLFHDYKGQPSKKQESKRTLTPKQREKEILFYYEEMKKQYQSNPQEWRLKNLKTIQELLAPTHIDQLTWKEIEKVCDCLHCMNSYSINKAKFTNKNNNTLKQIRSSWKHLLFSGEVTESVIKEAIKPLMCFGKTSARELVGWYYPEKYPIINHNSLSGMRFFGYDLKG